MLHNNNKGIQGTLLSQVKHSVSSQARIHQISSTSNVSMMQSTEK